MGSRQQTEGGGARLSALSRRAMLVGTSAAAAASGANATAPLQLGTPSSGYPTKLYEHWVFLDAEIERLLLRWGDLEGCLMTDHNWYQLDAYLSSELQSSPAGSEPKPLRGAEELRDIEGMIELLLERRAALLENLPARGAATLEELIARLAVAEQLIWNEDHLEAEALIAGTRQDLASLLEHGRLPGR